MNVKSQTRRQKTSKNVNLNTIISYIKDGEVHSFMDDYEESGKRKSAMIEKNEKNN